MQWNINGRKVVRQHHGNFPDFTDSVEMTGLRCSLVVDYGTENQGELKLAFKASFPEFRFKPNMTRDGFLPEFSAAELPGIIINGRKVREYCHRFSFDGVLEIQSHTSDGVEITREISPSADKALFFQHLTVTNNSSEALEITTSRGADLYQRGMYGTYQARTQILPVRSQRLSPGTSCTYGIFVTASTENRPPEFPDPAAELFKRRARIAELTAPLRLKTGVPELDTLFHFCKIRAGESIFATRSGLLHSPGASYYSGIWCNDQLEYAAPYFALTGDPNAIEASLNAFEKYSPFMGHDYFHIPSAVVSEGLNIWEMRGDRGDAAMYAYASALFMLNSGSRQIAERLWPSLEWCLEYCKRKRNSAGVVESDTDELENRLPAGSANLCTSVLYYGGLHYGSIAAAASGRNEQSAVWRREAEEMAAVIEEFFGSDMNGLKTYRYYDGNTSLRSWIGLPLCLGLFARAAGTVDAIFSPRLWSADGCRSDEANQSHIWDRSTLYCLRGAFRAGFADRSAEKLIEYSRARVAGAHIPYPVEAFTLNCRHSSAESALYCRIFTEGVLGWEPAGFDAFSLTPHIPQAWKEIELNNIHLFNTCFDIRIGNKGGEICNAEGKCRTFTPGEVIKWPL